MKLRKYTPKLARKREAAARSERGEASWKARYDFLKEAVEDFEEELDGSRFEDVDVSLLDALFTRVCEEYDRPANEAAAEALERNLASLDLERLQSALEAAERLADRQVFRNVR